MGWLQPPRPTANEREGRQGVVCRKTLAAPSRFMVATLLEHSSSSPPAFTHSGPRLLELEVTPEFVRGVSSIQRAYRRHVALEADNRGKVRRLFCFSWVPFAPCSAHLGTPLRVMFFPGHVCVGLGLCYIDAVRQPSFAPDLD